MFVARQRQRCLGWKSKAWKISHDKIEAWTSWPHLQVTKMSWKHDLLSPMNTAYLLNYSRSPCRIILAFPVSYDIRTDREGLKLPENPTNESRVDPNFVAQPDKGISFTFSWRILFWTKFAPRSVLRIRKRGSSARQIRASGFGVEKNIFTDANSAWPLDFWVDTKRGLERGRESRTS